MGQQESSFDEFLDVEHLVIFVHGVGFNGHKHGIALREYINQNHTGGLKIRVYNATGNIGFTSVMTMMNTISGIQAGGTRILNELQGLLRRKELSSVRYMSCIGASMGGLYLRFAFKDLKLLCDEKRIEFHSFITLATPHLGISGLHTAYSLHFLNRLQTGCDLQCNQPEGKISIETLCEEQYTNGLKAFSNCVAYAPVYNDGMVAFPSAAICLSYENEYEHLILPNTVTQQVQYNGQTKTILHGEEPLFLCETTSLHQVDKKEFYFRRDQEGENIEKAITSMVHRLRDGIEWKVVHTNLDHRSLATLSPKFTTTKLIIQNLSSHLVVPNE